MSRPHPDNHPFLTLFDLIGELARRRYLAAERSFAPLGLNHTEARLLSLLHQAGGEAAQDSLSASLTVDRSNAVRALQRLECDHYVLRSKDAADKRANLVRLTPKGRKAVLAISKLRHEIARTFFGGLTAPEATTVISLLRKAQDT